ncbi:RidA family protein [Ruegeria sp. 1NDH52C]|uniref:RidA family protein n=1 Tax=Ruegeria alba TaxID=2916756 RepID=A0ABS9P2B3_9RHOB|nr:RidA family protein [Ruegeria alba]MCE8523587.1 RidA family protein [Ruegeria pomeroyi]MCE8553416.1 RidA family protein [Ruegeria pomeroyi]MCG6560625.1 RidA family protein [Ruegeria alba]
MTVHRIGLPPVLPNGAKVPLVPATRVGNLIFCSGALGVDASFKPVDGGVGAQTRQAIANLKAVLAEAGATLADVAKTTVWLTDLENFAEFNTAYAEAFGDAFPARSTVTSALAIPGALVEIEAVAAIPETDKKS